MPYYYDRVTGEKVYVKLILNLLAIINRTTGGPIFEMFTNFASRKVGEEMKLLSTMKEREKLLWDYIGMFNPQQRKEMKAVYDKLSKKEKEEYLDYCMNVKIHMHQRPAWDTEDPIFYRLSRIADTFDFIQRDDIYINKWGREIKCLNKACVANMYIMMLKQTSKKGFSVRGAEAINTKELPERSYKSKKFLEKYSSTAIRFGEFESLNFTIGMLPEELVLFNAFYRTSIEARKDMAVAIVNNEPIIKMKKTYVSRAAEIFKVIMKSLSYEVDFYNDDDVLEELQNDEVKEFTIDDETYLCTDFTFYLIKKAKDIIFEILDEYGVLETDEIKEMVKEVLKEKNILCGEPSMTENMINAILDDPRMYDPTKCAQESMSISEQVDLINSDEPENIEEETPKKKRRTKKV